MGSVVVLETGLGREAFFFKGCVSDPEAFLF